jgi:hypothetical protein
VRLARLEDERGAAGKSLSGRRQGLRVSVGDVVPARRREGGHGEAAMNEDGRGSSEGWKVKLSMGYFS